MVISLWLEIAEVILAIWMENQNASSRDNRIAATRDAFALDHRGARTDHNFDSIDLLAMTLFEVSAERHSKLSPDFPISLLIAVWRVPDGFQSR